MKSLLTVCLVAGVLASCSNSDDNNRNSLLNNPENNVVETIGPDGGEVRESGAVVKIPADALGEEVEIGIAELSSAATTRLAATLDANLELVSSLYAVTPHGTSFARAVAIEIPYNSTSEGLRFVRLDDEDDTTWEEATGALFRSGRATFATTRFSVLGVVAPIGTVTNNDTGPTDTGARDMGVTTD